MIDENLIGEPVFTFNLLGDASQVGELVFGCIDTNHHCWELVNLPLIETWWEMSFDARTFGGSFVATDQKRITDSGTCLLAGHTTAVDCMPQQASASKTFVGGEYTLDCSSRSILPELKVTLGGQDFFLTGVLDISGDTVFSFTGVDVPGLTAPWIMGDVVMRKLPNCAQSLRFHCQALTRRACCVGRIHEQ